MNKGSAAVLSALVLFVTTQLYAAIPYYHELADDKYTPQEIFLRSGLPKLKGQSICLITNQAGLGRYLFWPPLYESHLTRLHEIFADAAATLADVFTPEHGLTAQEEEHGNQQKNLFTPKTLYRSGQSDIITQYASCGVVVFDLPDAGVRPYTYRSIMTSSMRALAASGKGQIFYLIDTPNPASFVGIDGPVAQKEKFSILGEEEIPHLPYYTYGELASYYKGKMQLNLKLVIQKLRKYNPRKHFLTQPSFFNPPSPNLPHFRAMQCYWMMVLLENRVIEEGRGTKDPFCQFGHPGFDPTDTPPSAGGAAYKAYSFIPQSGRFKGKLVHGYRIEIEDPDEYQPVKAGYELLRYLIKKYPDISFLLKYGGQYYALDELNGSDTMRKALQQDMPYEQWHKSEEPKLKKFKQEMKKYQLY